MFSQFYHDCEMTNSRSGDYFIEYRVLQMLKIGIVSVSKNVCLNLRRILVLWQQQPNGFCAPVKDKVMADGTKPSSHGRNKKTRKRRSGRSGQKARKLYAALDLGTNNCRLLIATPSAGGFRVVDGLSRIVRLGEGLEQTEKLSDAAMDRALEALKACSF